MNPCSATGRFLFIFNNLLEYSKLDDACVQKVGNLARFPDLFCVSIADDRYQMDMTHCLPLFSASDHIFISLH